MDAPVQQVLIGQLGIEWRWPQMGSRAIAVLTSRGIAFSRCTRKCAAMVGMDTLYSMVIVQWQRGGIPADTRDGSTQEE